MAAPAPGPALPLALIGESTAARRAREALDRPGAAPLLILAEDEIGRASCRERV